MRTGQRLDARSSQKYLDAARVNAARAAARAARAAGAARAAVDGARDVAQRFLENRARAALKLRPRTRALRRRAAPRPIRADIVVLREDEVLLVRLSGPSRG